MRALHVASWLVYAWEGEASAFYSQNSPKEALRPLWGELIKDFGVMMVSGLGASIVLYPSLSLQ